ncbi:MULTISPECIES: single-stranded DNA-binding protein [Streptomyces]|uniref:Single-stranded DNA-binding protein n=1 Tax=Streptomyces mordarskii TaxID=1226758 RepID=A0ABN1DXA9_9ACTN
MAGETVMTVCGNLVDEVELRFLPNGTPVAKFRVASTPRRFDKDTNQWEDDKDKALFLTVQVWRQQAEHCAESLVKGMRVIVQGQLSQRSYEDREGVRRTVYELTAEEVAPSLKMATAKVTKASSSGGGRQQQGQQARGGQQSPSGDPWASQAPAGAGGGGWGASGGDEQPPF